MNRNKLFVDLFLVNRSTEFFDNYCVNEWNKYWEGNAVYPDNYSETENRYDAEVSYHNRELNEIEEVEKIYVDKRYSDIRNNNTITKRDYKNKLYWELDINIPHLNKIIFTKKSITEMANEFQDNMLFCDNITQYGLLYGDMKESVRNNKVDEEQFNIYIRNYKLIDCKQKDSEEEEIEYVSQIIQDSINCTNDNMLLGWAKINHGFGCGLSTDISRIYQSIKNSNIKEDSLVSSSLPVNLFLSIDMLKYKYETNDYLSFYKLYEHY
eukprot:TRINITY_DN2850_c0_g1_i1.p1 TRINITY_DN2850_c0_g1~~TRINITY_DN2850_c0_g1_i1.p1  ORF type:complete len:267 (-),score=29.20 TRINITY_DN2850_c0_g1_i1:55-855(-)